DLGGSLKIDPFFFASHLYSTFSLTSARAPPNSLLPSRKKKQNFTNLLYHRVLETKVPSHRGKLLRHMNLARRAIFPPRVNNLQLAIVQHAFSALMTELADGTWLCIMLVDPPLGDNSRYIIPDSDMKRAITIPAQFFNGGYEDFIPPQVGNAVAGKWPSLRPQRIGMFEDLVFYLTREIPQDFHFERPTLVQLSQHALRIIAAEWVVYETVMNITAKEFEYTIPRTPDTYLEIEKLNVNLKSLQSWLRRSNATQIKIRSVIELIENEGQDEEPWQSLLDDYKHICRGIEHYARRLETMLPMVASFVQIIDSRRSFAETVNISRLTYLAIVFIPLSYVTGLFSMNPNVGPGGERFWVYFTVAIPMTIFVFLIAR
ncbi:hypothetical protein CC78DRAFT_447030, partial [Lojkania enalia]